MIGNGMRGYDTWLTHEPSWMHDDIPATKRCSECGKFLLAQPTGKRVVEEFAWCGGKARVHTGSYNDGSHEGILAIIGEERRNETYVVAYSPPCGTKEGGDGAGCTENQEEIQFLAAEDWTHKPHWTPAYGAAEILIYTCANGHKTEEVL